MSRIGEGRAVDPPLRISIILCRSCRSFPAIFERNSNHHFPKAPMTTDTNSVSERRGHRR